VKSTLKQGTLEFINNFNYQEQNDLGKTFVRQWLSHGSNE
jgi:hypothetical protein